MKTTIYLWVKNKGWKPFILEESSQELIDRNISVGSGCTLGDGCIVKNGIYLYGSKHSVSYWGENKIQIGCICSLISEWVENFEAVGKNEGYSAIQIAEYFGYIKLIETFHNSKNQTI